MTKFLLILPLRAEEFQPQAATLFAMQKMNPLLTSSFIPPSLKQFGMGHLWCTHI